MSRLFIFAIGGTGARVIKALTMLLANGIEIQAEEVVPILIDPHTENEDLQRTLTQLKLYQEIYSKVSNNGQHKPNGFFKTRIRTLQEVSNIEEMNNTFSFGLQNIRNDKFSQYIDFGQLDESNKSLASLLFSEQALDTEMDIGFVGQPNIGSVVLNQFKDSSEFSMFANSFRQNDRIFIVSSIFGGTGAAGFPLILKNIREAHNIKTNSKPLQNPEFLEKAVIGAVSVLPYFNLKNSDDDTTKPSINSADFIAKTTSALNYYSKNVTRNNVTGNNSVNAMYYLGDDSTKLYENDPGNNGQKNDAHFIELVAALSIFDFMAMTNCSQNSTVFKEFGIKNNSRELTFNDFGQYTQQMIKKTMAQYFVFHRFLQQAIKETITNPFFKGNIPIDIEFTKSYFYNLLENFNNHYEKWLQEMANNERKFVPFNLQTREVNRYLNGIEPKKQKWYSLNKNEMTFNGLIHQLNMLQDIKYSSKEHKISEGFWAATDKLLKECYTDF